jgi:hypothetical protein
MKNAAESDTSLSILRESTYIKENRGSSVSIVSGFGLDDRAIKVGFQAEAKGIFL